VFLRGCLEKSSNKWYLILRLYIISFFVIKINLKLNVIKLTVDNDDVLTNILVLHCKFNYCDWYFKTLLLRFLFCYFVQILWYISINFLSLCKSKQIQFEQYFFSALPFPCSPHLLSFHGNSWIQWYAIIMAECVIFKPMFWSPCFKYLREHWTQNMFLSMITLKGPEGHEVFFQIWYITFVLYCIVGFSCLWSWI